MRAPRGAVLSAAVVWFLLAAPLVASATGEAGPAPPAPPPFIFTAHADATHGTDVSGCGDAPGREACASARAALARAQELAHEASAALRVLLAPGTYSGANNTNLVVEGDVAFEALGHAPGASPSVVFDLSSRGRAFVVRPLAAWEGAEAAWWADLEDGDDASSAVEPFDCPQAALRLRGVSVTNGAALGSGGAVHCARAALDFEDAAFVGNGAANWGGAVYADGCSLTLSRVSFRRNSAAVRGGALAVRLLYASRRVQLLDCEVEGNAAAIAGGVAISDPECMQERLICGLASPSDQLPAVCAPDERAARAAAKAAGATKDAVRAAGLDRVRPGGNLDCLQPLPGNGWAVRAVRHKRRWHATRAADASAAAVVGAESAAVSARLSRECRLLRAPSSPEAPTRLYGTLIVNTTFSNNTAAVSAGALLLDATRAAAALGGDARVEGARFVYNVVDARAARVAAGGAWTPLRAAMGAALVARLTGETPRADESPSAPWGAPAGGGAGVALDLARARFERCAFSGNLVDADWLAGVQEEGLWPPALDAAPGLEEAAGFAAAAFIGGGALAVGQGTMLSYWWMKNLAEVAGEAPGGQDEVVVAGSALAGNAAAAGFGGAVHVLTPYFRLEASYVGVNAARWGSSVFVGAAAGEHGPVLRETAFEVGVAGEDSTGSAFLWIKALSSDPRFDLARAAAAAGCFLRLPNGELSTDLVQAVSTEAVRVAVRVAPGATDAVALGGENGGGDAPRAPLVTSAAVLATAPVLSMGERAGDKALVVYSSIQVLLLDAYGAPKAAPATARCRVGTFHFDHVGTHSGDAICRESGDFFARPGWSFGGGMSLPFSPAQDDAWHGEGAPPRARVAGGGDMYPIAAATGADGAIELGNGSLQLGGWVLGAEYALQVSCYEEGALSACKWSQPTLFAERGCCYHCGSSSLGLISSPEVAASLLPANLTVRVSPACPPGSEPRNGECASCPAGTYSWHGEECTACPGTYAEGALCPGGANLLPREGYWRAEELSTLLVKCPLRGACRGCNATVPCTDADAPLLAERPCVDGYEGPVCAVCQEGFFKWQAQCVPCPRSAASRRLFIALVCLAVLIVMSLCFSLPLTPTPGTGYPTVKLKIMIALLQICATIGQYDVPWPNVVSQSFGALIVVNLDVEVARPECMDTQSTFLNLYSTTMLLPVLLVAPMLLLAAFSQRVIKRRADRCACAMEEGADAGASACMGNDDDAPWLRQLQARLPELGELQARCWRIAFQLMSMLYMTTCRRALMLYSYHSLEIGTFLRADYSVMVGEVTASAAGMGSQALGGEPADLLSLAAIRAMPKEYQPYFVVGFLLLPAYAFGVPALFAGVLYYHRRELDCVVVQQRYGFLIQGYRATYWEVVEMLRKLFMVVLAVVPISGAMQCFVGELVTLIFLALHSVYRPFVTQIDNNLQTFALALVGLYLLIGLVQVSEERGTTLTGRAMGFLMLVSIGGFVSLISTTVFHIFRHKFLKAVSSVSRPVMDVTKRAAKGVASSARRAKEATLAAERAAAGAMVAATWCCTRPQAVEAAEDSVASTAAVNATASPQSLRLARLLEADQAQDPLPSRHSAATDASRLSSALMVKGLAALTSPPGTAVTAVPPLRLPQSVDARRQLLPELERQGAPTTASPVPPSLGGGVARPLRSPPKNARARDNDASEGEIEIDEVISSAPARAAAVTAAPSVRNCALSTQ